MVSGMNKNLVDAVVLWRAVSLIIYHARWSHIRFLCTIQDASHLSANMEKKLMHVPSWKTIEFSYANGFEAFLCWNAVESLVQASTAFESVEDARKF